MKKARTGEYLLLAALVFVLLAFIIYPLVLTFAESLREGGRLSFNEYRRFLDPEAPANLEALLNSVVLSILSVIFSGIVGIGLAYLVSEFDFPLRTLLKRIAVLPIALPPLVGVIAFLFLYGESGVLPRLTKEILGLPRPPLYLEGFAAILFVHTYSFYVYYYLFVSSLLARMDTSVVEAAANLGSSRWHTVRKVVIPLLMPAIVGASLLTFMASMASFSAPFLFAGDQRFMTLQIYNAKLNGEMGLASTHSVVLVISSIFFLFLLRWYSAGRRYVMGVRGVGRTLTRRMTKISRTLAAVGAFVAILFILLPVVGIVVISFAEEGSWTWQLVPSRYTFSNYLNLFTEEDFFRPIANSTLMATFATTANVGIGLAIAFLMTRRTFRPRGVHVGVETLSILPFAIPGTVIALSLIVAFNQPTWLSGGQVLVGTFWILPLAYFIRTLPLVVRSTFAGFAIVDRSLEEVAHNLGGGTWRTSRKIVLPLILPSIVSGALLAMITALGEFVSSILLYTYENRPIAVEILAQMRLYNFGGAAAYGVLLLIIVIVVTYVATRLTEDRNRRQIFVF